MQILHNTQLFYYVFTGREIRKFSLSFRYFHSDTVFNIVPSEAGRVTLNNFAVGDELDYEFANVSNGSGSIIITVPIEFSS